MTWLNREQLARALGVSANTVNDWVGKGCPVEQVGTNGRPYQFDADKVMAWRDAVAAEAEDARRIAEDEVSRVQRELDLRQRTDDDAVASLSARSRKEFYDAEAARQRLAESRGDLVRRDEVTALMAELLGYLADQAQALPDLLEREASLSPAAVDAAVRAIDRWQGDLAATVERWNTPDDDVAAA